MFNASAILFHNSADDVSINWWIKCFGSVFLQHNHLLQWSWISCHGRLASAGPSAMLLGQHVCLNEGNILMLWQCFAQWAIACHPVAASTCWYHKSGLQAKMECGISKFGPLCKPAKTCSEHAADCLLVLFMQSSLVVLKVDRNYLLYPPCRV